MSKTLADLIQGRLAEIGRNQSEATAIGGLGRTFINDIITGNKTGIQSRNTEKLAKALGWTVEEFNAAMAGVALKDMAERDAIPVVGIVEAGAFREMPAYFTDGNHNESPLIVAERSSQYRGARHFAMEVRGDSMNAARPWPILPGMHVLCVDMVSAELMVETGRIYVVRRTLNAGQTWELTVKRARVFRDRVELHPESLNKIHVPLVIPRGHDDDGTEVSAIGLVYGFYGSLEL
jgi:SOS-response transcriptional repressor LexA